MNMLNNCLVAGAVIAASGAANAAQISYTGISDVNHSLFHVSEASELFASDLAFPGTPLNSSLSRTDSGSVQTTSVSTDSASIRVDYTWDGVSGPNTASGGSDASVVFSLDSAADVVISWDTNIMQNNVSGGTFIRIIDQSFNTVYEDTFIGIENNNFASLRSGSTTISLDAGVVYTADFSLQSRPDPGAPDNSGLIQFGIDLQTSNGYAFEAGTAFINLEVVPAPGTAGLLAFAGVAAARRRR